jgi:hypothetical protein
MEAAHFMTMEAKGKMQKVFAQQKQVILFVRS